MALLVKSFITHPVSQRVANLFWAVNGDNVEFVQHGPVDIALFDARYSSQELRHYCQYPATISVCLDLAHAGRDKMLGWSGYQCDRRNYVVLECTDSQIQNSSHLCIDWIFNRTKAFYTRDLATANMWYWTSPLSFDLWPISPEVKHKSRLFVSASRLLRPDLIYRCLLADRVQRIYHDQGYFSNIREYNFCPGFAEIDDFNSKMVSVLDKKLYGQCLVGQHEAPNLHSVKELTDWARAQSPSDAVSGYHPLHNAYYNETYFSVYCETIEISGTVCVTEKTFDPLIKGHFILPFGSAGTVAAIRRHGFRLPEFIDYSYDTEVNDDLRFEIFIQEFERLVSLGHSQWQQHWVDNQDLLRYNRQVFWDRDYDRVNFNQLLRMAS